MTWLVENCWEPPPIENEGDRKRDFAKAMRRYPNDAYRAACIVFPNDAALAQRISITWQFDPHVMAMMDSTDVEIQLPPKDQVCLEVIELARTAIDPKDKLAAFKLYAELNGMVQKEQTNVNVNIANKVMQVSNSGSDEQWELAALKNQRMVTESVN